MNSPNNDKVSGGGGGGGGFLRELISSVRLPIEKQELVLPPADSVSSLAFSPKAPFLAATSWDAQVSPVLP